MSDEGLYALTLPDVKDSIDPDTIRRAFRLIEQFAVDVEAAIDRQETASGYTRMPATGRWFFPTRATGDLLTATHATTADRLYYLPFTPDRNVTIVALGFNVTVSGGTLARMGIYSDSNGVPGDLLVETGDMDPSTTGDKTAAISYAVTNGTGYWVAMAFDGTPTVRAMADSDATGLSGSGPDANTGYADFVYETLGASWTALPTSAGTLTYGSGNVPAMACQL